MATYKAPHTTLTTPMEWDEKSAKARADRAAEVAKQVQRTPILTEQNQATAVNPQMARHRQVMKRMP
jgi:hypothetical protein